MRRTKATRDIQRQLLRVIVGTAGMKLAETVSEIDSRALSDAAS
jgi:hypothetical protein